MESGDKKLFAGAAAFVLLVGAGAWFFVVKAPPPAPEPAPAPASVDDVANAVVKDTAAVSIFWSSSGYPALEESDDWVRTNAGALSKDARFQEWLKNSNLLQRWAAAVNMVARGAVPQDALSFLRPRRKFVPLEKDDRYFLDPRSYARYDGIADAFASIDPKAAGEFFTRARPLIDKAWSGLGEPGGGVVDALGRAARVLLEAPVLPDRAELRPSDKGIVYQFVDDALEGRSAAQKQLMRMGPRNQRKVQAQVRALALAAGVPAARLP